MNPLLVPGVPKVAGVAWTSTLGVLGSGAAGAPRSVTHRLVAWYAGVNWRSPAPAPRSSIWKQTPSGSSGVEVLIDNTFSDELLAFGAQSILTADRIGANRCLHQNRLRDQAGAKQAAAVDAGQQAP